jgi:hypothetical protein
MHVITTVDSAAQAMLGLRPPSVARVSRQWSSRGERLTAPQPSVAAAGPTWSPTFPTISDFDSPPLRGAHSAVYDPGSNILIVFGGFDGNFAMPSNVLIDTNANGSGGPFAGAWSFY